MVDKSTEEGKGKPVKKEETPIAKPVADVSTVADVRTLFSVHVSNIPSPNQNEEEGEDEDGEGEEDETPGAAGTGEGGKKKKKKKKSNKKKPKAGAAVPSKEQHIRLLTGFTDYYVAYGQTEPPTKPVSELFAKGSFPTGQILPHGKTKYPDPNSSYARLSEEEKRCVSSVPGVCK
jgi:hypothetical protein